MEVQPLRQVPANLASLSARFTLLPHNNEEVVGAKNSLGKHRQYTGLIGGVLGWFYYDKHADQPPQNILDTA